jgi:hypothetical protein
MITWPQKSQPPMVFPVLLQSPAPNQLSALKMALLDYSQFRVKPANPK